MGYDEDECLVCYLSGDGNVSCHGSAITCLKCINKLSKNRNVGRAITSIGNGIMSSSCKAENKCDCYCECFGEDRIQWRDSWMPQGYTEDNNEPEEHWDCCDLQMCMMKGCGSCHDDCERCSCCDICPGGSVVVKGSACSDHGGSD